jgi:hypothetical protein
VELKIAYGRHLAVPSEAVLDSGTVQTVFVARDDATFEPRQVTIGATVDGKTIITSGLKRGETIVESGNFLLDSDTQLNAPMDMNGTNPGATGTGGAKTSGTKTSGSSSMPGMDMGGAK